MKTMAVAWPAFLAACALEALVFALVDPLEMHWSAQALGLSRQPVYAMGFFAFWVVTSLACWLSVTLAARPAEA